MSRRLLCQLALLWMLLALVPLALAQDDALLRAANTNLLRDPFRYEATIQMTLPDGTVDASGTGVYRPAGGGLFGIGRQAAGFTLYLAGNSDIAGLREALNLDVVGVGDALYFRGLAGDEWLSVPGAALGGLGGTLPGDDALPGFLTITRLPDAPLGDRSAARFRMTYDLNAPVIREMAAQALAGLPAFGGALATGEQAAALLDNASLTVEQTIDPATRTVQQLTVDFRLDDSRITLDMRLFDHGQRVEVRRPPEAAAFDFAAP